MVKQFQQGFEMAPAIHLVGPGSPREGGVQGGTKRGRGRATQGTEMFKKLERKKR